MLEITIPKGEAYNEATGEFIYTKEQTLKLEHSLVSISKWESKWHKPFLTKQPKTREEEIDYFKTMTLTQNVDPVVYEFITKDIAGNINNYIDNPMTATTFSKRETGGGNGEQVTSELIYYWMVSLNIPFECQKWHLNRLLTLIRVCNVKNQLPKKMSKSELMSRNAAINAARRRKHNTKG